MNLLNVLFLSFLPAITLNVFDDIKDGIEKFLKDSAIDGIKFCFSYIVNLLSGGMSNSGIGEAVSTYLTSSPSDINGSLWGNVSKLATSTVVPIALVIVAIVSVSDMFIMVTSGNNMRDFDTSIFFKWIIKTEIALTLVSNSVSFVGLVFTEGATIATKAYGTVGMGSLATKQNLDKALTETLKNYPLPKLGIILVLSAVTLLAVYALFITILVVLCSRTIEAVMYLSIAPIPMATFMNPDFRQVGNAWARGIFALAFQAFFIIVALAFFKSMFNDVIDGIENKTDIVWNMTKMAGYSIALIFTVLRTGQISKTMFSAH